MASSAAFFFLFVAFASSFFLCSAYRSEDLESDQKIRTLFDHWCLKHGKIYQWDIEKESRFLNFKSNLLWIDAQNKQNDRSFWLGLNQFADLTDQEMESLFTNRRDAEETIKMVTESNLPSTNSVSRGSSIDWRQKGAVTAVKNIESCTGASWAFAATGSLEGLHKIKTGKLNGFSEQELLDCDTRGRNKGCDSGDAVQALKYIVHHGIASNSNYPFHSEQRTCENIDQEEKVYIEDYRRFSGPDSILADLLTTGPTIVHLDASAKEFVFYAGGIYTGPCHDTETNLYALAVGYKSEEGSNYFIMKNSWGDGWGEEGYMRIKQEDELAYGRCGISSNMAIPIDLKTSEELIDSQPKPYEQELEHEWPIPAIPPGIIYPPPAPLEPPSIFESPPPPPPHHYSSPPPPPPSKHHAPPPPSKHHAPPPPSIFPAPPSPSPAPAPAPAPAPTESTPPPPSPSSSPHVFSPFRSSIRALQGLFAVYMLEFVLV